MLHSVERKMPVETPEAICTQTITSNAIRATPTALSDMARHALIVQWWGFIFE
jgi:hypothetical protein